MTEEEIHRAIKEGCSIRGSEMLVFSLVLMMASILSSVGGYRLCEMKNRHLITVQEVTEIQDGILEDVWELRWRADSLEVHDGVYGAEIKSLKKKLLVNY